MTEAIGDTEMEGPNEKWASKQDGDKLAVWWRSGPDTSGEDRRGNCCPAGLLLLGSQNLLSLRSLLPSSRA